MAFQNNSGDIILDVVLTDEGRRRLALGDGSFGITQFALADDEINYELFDLSQTTALQDLSILQTPVLEAFTNNTSAMKSKLISLTNQNLLYLPVLKLNTIFDTKVKTTDEGNYVVCTNKATWDDGDTNLTKAIAQDGSDTKNGMINGIDADASGFYIKIDSGIDSTDVTDIDPSLVESSFFIYMDNRLGQLVSKDGLSLPTPISIDDDHVATYLVQKRVNRALGVENGSFVSTPTRPTDGSYSDSNTPINGPWESTLEFKIRASQDIRTSDFLFDRIGSTDSSTYTDKNGDPQEVKIIDTTVRVTGRTTGYSIDIPVRYAKSV